MPMPSTIEACKLDLFAKKEELAKKYPPVLVEKIIRIRDIYTYFLNNPDAKDRELVSELMNRYAIEKTAAYSDLAVVKQLLPMVGQASREFHRWRFNEMILETYQRAMKRGDQKTMESDFKEYMGDSSALHEIFVDDTILFTGSALSDSYKEIKLSSFIQNKLPDVMIMDEEYYGQYKESGMLQPFIKVMSEEEQESLGIRAEDGYGVMMTGNQKLEEYGFLIDGDSYLVVMQDAAHPEEAKDFIEFLCG